MSREHAALFFAVLAFFSLSSGSSGQDSLIIGTDKDAYTVGEVVKIYGSTLAENVSISVLGAIPLAAVKLVPVTEGSFEHEYNIRPGDYGRVLVRVEAYGSLFSAAEEKQISVEKDYYSSALDVEFITPASNERFYRDSNITIKVRVTESSSAVDNANVYCIMSMPGLKEAEKTLALRAVGEFFTDTYSFTEDDVRMGGIYYRNYQIGRGDPAQIWVIKCAAEKNDGAKKSGGASRPIRVANSPIIIDVLSPAKNIIESGENLDVIVRAYYENHEPAKNAVIIVEDSEGRITKLNQVTETGLFEFKNYDSRSDNDYLSLTVSASDDVGNAGKNTVLFRVVRNSIPDLLYRLWWVLPMIMAIVLLTIFLEKEMEYTYFDNLDRPRKLRSGLKELQEEKEGISDAKTSLEKNYYKRRVDEKTFRQMMEDYERKTIELDMKIKRVKDELREF